MNGFEETFNPHMVNGLVLAQNVATMGRVASIEVEIDVHARDEVTVELRYKLSMEDWEFALKHSLIKGESE